MFFGRPELAVVLSKNRLAGNAALPRRFAINYEVILKKDESGWIVDECPELSGCVSQGKNEAKALANIRGARPGWLWAEEERTQRLSFERNSWPLLIQTISTSE
jgi:predicted RNase H-like HicB family nuclease